MKRLCFLTCLLIVSFKLLGQSKALVFQSDFGVKDAAVSAMKGVAYGVSHEIAIFDNTHEIPAYNIWEAAYRLDQAAKYWPSGTVFVSVVDPGVGSERKSIVLKTRSGHYFVTPDNGTITLVAKNLGIDQVRVIDEAVNRRRNSDASYTFHGRDVYAFTGARLASGTISFEQVGPMLQEKPVTLQFQEAVLRDGGIAGTIDILDIQYGNAWTNISAELFKKLSVNYGDVLEVQISNGGKQVYKEKVTFGRTFSDVAPNKDIAYLNSLLNLALGINQADFAAKYKVGSGPDWKIFVKKS